MITLYRVNKYEYIRLTTSKIGGNIRKHSKIEKYDKEYTLSSLDGELNGYPLAKYYSPNPSDMMKWLMNEEYIIDKNVYNDRKEKSRVNLIRYFPSDHILMDSISNHFTEHIRITCRFQNFDTPKETWDNKIKQIVREKLVDQIKNKGMVLKYRDVYEMIYRTDTCRICNTFNEAYCKWIITMGSKIINKSMNEINILDPSAGWGDRMIGSIASGVRSYTGYDPNKKLEESYNNIIDWFKDDYDTKIKMHMLPFEESNEQENYYDMIITSPPYYTVEIYDDDDEQSVVKYPKYEDWVKNMYDPYLTKAYTYLKKGGIMVIYIEDVKVDNKYYPLSKLTNNIITKLGGKQNMLYGLNVIYEDEQKGGGNECNKRCARSWIKQ